MKVCPYTLNDSISTVVLYGTVTVKVICLSHSRPASHFSRNMAASLSVRPHRLSPGSSFPSPPVRRLRSPLIGNSTIAQPWRGSLLHCGRALTRTTAPVQSGSRADDSAPFEMSVKNALKVLGVSEGASFDDILRARNSILANCKDDQESIAQVFLSCSFAPD